MISIEKRIKEFGIKSIKNTEDIHIFSKNFAFSPGISKPYINQEKRKEFRRSMSLGVRS